MKHHITLLAALLLAAQTLSAIPAKPGKIRYIQPDGSVVVLQLHGDEFHHWATDENGDTVDMDGNGFYRKTFSPTPATLSARQAIRQQAQADRMLRAASAGNLGERRFLVVLVEFSDLTFKVDNPQQTFHNLLNQAGFSDNGATGSVRDFFVDNSMGRFVPVFDVYGPVRVDHEYSYYGGNSSGQGSDSNPGRALVDACSKLDESVDFSQYAVNGQIPAVLFYYAGYNEAEGGGSNTIWPHEWTLSSNGIAARSRTFDGVVMNTYSCTSELQGSAGSGVKLCGIGTACHEFGHALGLPDFYDTNDSTNGQAGGLYCYSTMDSGSYNNDGHTPPYFNALERTILGWMDGIDSMPASGTVSIPSIAENKAFQTLSDVQDEFFIYECRPGKGWDAALPGGMIVYHVDKSSSHSILGGSYTAKSVWNGSNMVNADGKHPCFYIIPAANPSSLYYSSASYDYQSKVGDLPFPGKTNKYTTYTPKGWSGASMDYFFTDISFQGADDPSRAVVTMTVSSGTRMLTGTVTDKKFAGISGATVGLYAASSSQVVGSRLRVRQMAAGAPLAQVVTDASGKFTIELTDTDVSTVDVVVDAEGYLTHRETLTIGPGINALDFVLYEENPEEEEMLYKFDPKNGAYLVGTGESVMAAVRYSAAELKDDVGRRVDGLTFVYRSAVTDGVYAFVDFGSERRCWVPVEHPVSGSFMTVDLRGYDIKIPADTDCYFGYALKNPSDDYPLIFEKDAPKDGGMFWSDFNPQGASWESYDGNIYVAVNLSPSVPFNYIKDEKNGTYRVGDEFGLELVTASNYRKPVSASWYYDDEPVSGTKIVLSEAGEHVVAVEITMQDGGKEVVELEIVVL